MRHFIQLLLIMANLTIRSALQLSKDEARKSFFEKSDVAITGDTLNPYPAFICGNGPEEARHLGSDEYLAKHGNTWPTAFFAKYLKTYKAMRFQKNGQVYNFLNSTVPMCQMEGVKSRFETEVATHISFQKSRELVSNASKLLTDKQQPIILIDVGGLAGPPEHIVSNTVCALRRLGLSSQTVAYVYDSPESNLQRLRSLAPEVTIIHDPDLQKMLPTFDHIFNRLRWIPVLHFLNQGYQVLHIDADNKLIKDPFAFLASEARDVDVAFAYENCLSFNGGTNFFRPTQRASQLLQTILGQQIPEMMVTTYEGKKETAGLDTGDQAFINCAISHEVVHSNLKIFAIPQRVNAFHWDDISGNLKKLCREDIPKSLANFPTFMHTCCTIALSTQTNLKLGGMWEVDMENKRCVDNYNPAAAVCGERLRKRDLTPMPAAIMTH